MQKEFYVVTAVLWCLSPVSGSESRHGKAGARTANAWTPPSMQVWMLEEEVGQKRGGRDETHMVPGSDKEHLVSTEASAQRVVVK